MLPLQPEHLGNAGPRGDACFNDKEVGFLEARQHARRLMNEKILRSYLCRFFPNLAPLTGVRLLLPIVRGLRRSGKSGS